MTKTRKNRAKQPQSVNVAERKLAKEVESLKKTVMANPANQMSKLLPRLPNQPKGPSIPKGIPSHYNALANKVWKGHLCPKCRRYAKLVDDPWRAKSKYNGVMVTPPITEGRVPCLSVPIHRYGSTELPIAAGATAQLWFFPEGTYNTSTSEYSLQKLTLTGPSTYAVGPQAIATPNGAIIGYYLGSVTPGSAAAWTSGTSVATYTPLSYDVITEPMEFQNNSISNESFRFTACGIR